MWLNPTIGSLRVCISCKKESKMIFRINNNYTDHDKVMPKNGGEKKEAPVREMMNG